MGSGSQLNRYGVNSPVVYDGRMDLMKTFNSDTRGHIWKMG